MPSVCPRCSSFIAVDRYINGIYFCLCGWSTSGKQAKKGIGLSTFAMGIFGLFLVFSFIFAARWGKFTTEFFSLKVSQALGKTSLGDLERIAHICELRTQYTCLESTYKIISNLEPRNLFKLTRLAEAQVNNKNYNGAAVSYRNYFKTGGKKGDIAFKYAHVLDKRGFTKDATNYYRYALRSKRNTDPGIAREYVRMLIRSKNFNKARGVILNFRKKNKMASLFLENELKQIRRGIASI